MIFRALIAELKRIASCRIYLCSLTLFPMLSILFFAIFFHNNAIDNLPIAVIDNDQTTTSQSLISLFDATPSVCVAFRAQSHSEAELLMRRGEIVAFVMIPKHFESQILQAQSTTVALYNSGTNISTNGFIERDIQSVVTTFGAAVTLNILGSKGLNQQQGLAQIMPVTFESHLLFNPYLNYGYYIAPCFMALIIIMFTSLSTVYAIAERKGNTQSTIIGRTLPTTVAMSFWGAIMLLMLKIVVNIPILGNIWLIFGGTIALIIAYQAIAILIVEISRSRHLALSLCSGYAVLAFTFSGLTFPTTAFYTPLKIASLFFPFTYYIDLMVDQTVRGASSIYSVGLVGKMLLFSIAPIFLRKRL